MSVVDAEIDGMSERILDDLLAKGLTIREIRGLGVRIWRDDRTQLDIDGSDRSIVECESAETLHMIYTWMEAQGLPYSRHQEAKQSVVAAFAAHYMDMPLVQLGVRSE